VGYDDGKKELGNSLNCKSYSLNPRRLSLNWEIERSNNNSHHHPPAHQMLPKTLAHLSKLPKTWD
jgi:hypothetical protein